MRKFCFGMAGVFMLPAMMQAATLDGSWTMSLNPNFGGMNESFPCSVSQAGTDFDAACKGFDIIGTIRDRKATFDLKTGRNNELTAKFTGTVNPEETQVDGTWRLVDSSGKVLTGKWQLTKQATR